MISYAQNFEDVMIARLFPRDHKGFYIDVGAADPDHLSVTKRFYEQGWQGINIEPLPRFHAKLTRERPRDLNLQVVVGTPSPSRQFFEINELPENSTSDLEVMAQLQQEGRTVITHQVEVMSLEEICRRHVGERTIDFMKIDVEGGELDVLQSADWERWRPVLLVIEAVVVNGRDPTWQGWEHVVTAHGYERVWFDALNNYYLRRESLDLKQHFELPPNVFDDFQQVRLVQSAGEWIDQGELVRRIDIDRRAKQEVIDRLIAQVAQLDADRKTKQDVIDDLARRLQETEQALRDRAYDANR